jgi:hypothetical protein
MPVVVQSEEEGGEDSDGDEGDNEEEDDDDDGDAALDDDDRRAAAELSAKQTGVKYDRPLLDAVPIQHFLVPPLHMLLGLVMSIVNNLFTFCKENLEVEYAPVVAAAQQTSAADARVQQLLTDLEGLPKKGGTRPVQAARKIQRAGLKKELSEARAQLRQAAAAEQLTRERHPCWAMANKMDAILRKYRVNRTVYHNQALVGAGCDRLLQHWQEIKVEIEQLWSTGPRREHLRADIAQEMARVLDSTGRAADVLYALKKTLYQSGNPTPQEIASFQKAASYLGSLYRGEQDLHLPVSIKLHLLESHASEQMLRFGTLRRFVEEPIEREHHLRKDLERRFGNITDFEGREAAMVRRDQRAEVPEVKAFILRQEESAKRKFGDAAKEKRENKRASAEQADERRIAATLQSIPEG